MPSDFTPESLAKYDQTRKFSDLIPSKNSGIGSYNPGQYTSDSWARFTQTGNPSELVRWSSPKVVNAGGTQQIVDVTAPGSPTTRSIPVTLKPGELPATRGAQSRAEAAGKEQGAADNSLSVAEASLPQIENTVRGLKEIGKDATFTMAGKGRDIVARQFGIATKGAVAREQYIQTVRDVLFPQLRATFGAQFTVKEGEALVATLGDPDKTPQERNAALDAFIDQKKQHLQTLRRQTGKADQSTIATPEEAATIQQGRAQGLPDSAIVKQLNKTKKEIPMKVPPGLTPAEWKYMSPEDRALWMK